MPTIRSLTLILLAGAAMAGEAAVPPLTEQLAAATAQLAAAEEAERLQSERFAAGAATASDLSAAEAVLAQARAAVADAQAGLRMTIADLRWQYGLPILP